MYGTKEKSREEQQKWHGGQSSEVVEYLPFSHSGFETLATDSERQSTEYNDNDGELSLSKSN